MWDRIGKLTRKLKIYLDLLQIWTCYSEISENITTVVKQFKRLLSMHKRDTFKGKLSYILALSCSCYLDTSTSISGWFKSPSL